MAKSRRAFLLESARNTLIGSGAFLVGAVTPSNISAPKVSDITDRMGTLRVGTLIAGDEAGAHSIIGARGDGIQMYSGPNRLVFYVSPSNNGRFRLGPVDRPGVTMANGDVSIDGDCNVDGSISASKLMITAGGLAYSLLESDRLLIGSGDWDAGTFTGFAATSLTIGGYNAGTEVWVIDTTTGMIISKDTQYPSQVYAQMGAGTFALGNIIDKPFFQRYEIAMASYYIDSVTEEPVFAGSLGVHGERHTLVLHSRDNDGSLPSLRLADYSGNDALTAGAGGMSIASGDLSKTLALTIANDGVSKWYTGGEKIVQMGFWNGVRVEEGNDITKIIGTVLGFRANAQTGAWVGRPAAPQEGDTRWDNVNHRQECYNGTEWRYYETAAA